MSPDSSAERPGAGSSPLVVQAVFHVSREDQAQTVAERMIETAHQIANLPECECDVDVSVSRLQPGAEAPETIGTPARARPAER